MKFLFSVIILSLILNYGFCIDSSHALVTILGDQDSGISVKFTAEDDPDDNDQTFTEIDQKIVQINNDMRRYLTVFIDRIIIPGGTNTPVDNGPNDEYMGTSSKLFTFASLYNFLGYAAGLSDVNGPAPASKRYRLPVPDNLGPGTEVRFRIKVLGPAAYKSVPTITTDQRTRLGYVTAMTSFEMLLLPLLSAIIGSDDFNFDMSDLLEDFIALGGLEIDLIGPLEDRDIIKIIETVTWFIAGSNTIKAALGKDYVLYNALTIQDIQKIYLGGRAAGELANSLIHLAAAEWVEQFDVLIIRPKVEELEPNAGGAGDIVTIRGLGFDTYDMENNRVYFTRLNSEGFPIQDAEAFIVGVPSENEMIVKVPTGFESGPVIVCTKSSIGDEIHAYCSNSDVMFEEGLPTDVRIYSPVHGETVSGAIEVNAEVADPPAPFPMVEAVLYVDATEFDRQWISGPTFTFPLDTALLTQGEHSIQVKVEFEPPTGVLDSEIAVIEVENDVPPGPGQHIYIDASGVTQDNWYLYKKEYYLPWDDHSEPIETVFHFPIFGDGPAFYAGGAGYYYQFTVYAWLQRFYPDPNYYSGMCNHTALGLPGRETRFYINAAGGPMYFDTWKMVNSYYPCSWDPWTFPSGCASSFYPLTSRIKFEVRINITTCVTSPP